MEHCLDGDVWAQREFGCALLGDKRRTRWLVRIASGAANAIGSALSSVCGIEDLGNLVRHSELSCSKYHTLWYVGPASGVKVFKIPYRRATISAPVLLSQEGHRPLMPLMPKGVLKPILELFIRDTSAGALPNTFDPSDLPNRRRRP